MAIGDQVAPVSRTERLHGVDVVRGAAILGILLVNLPLFFSPLYLEVLGQSWFEGGLDRLAKKAIVGFAQGKFYTIFSILFGFGLAIQFERFRSRGMTFGKFWSRRMGVLLAIGLFHGLVLWYGDILTWYALAGLLIFFFRKAKPKTLKIWVVILLALPLLLTLAITGLFAVASMTIDAAELDEMIGVARYEAELARAQELYPVAGFAEILPLNFGQWAMVAGSVVVAIPTLLGMFLIGLLFSRHRVFHETAAHLPRIRRRLMWLLPVAVVSNGAVAWVHGGFSMLIPSANTLLFSALLFVGQLSGCLAYISLLLIAFHSPRAHRFVAPLGAVGRMALTNYLTHTLVFTTLANGYGAGLYGRISPSIGLAMTFGMFAIQIALSNWWLGRFRFGPMEWLWRSLTYGTIQRMSLRS